MSSLGRKALCMVISFFCSLVVVLGWIISLCVGPGIEPATFRFRSKALITPLPSLRSSSTVPKPGIEPATFRFQSKVLVTPLPSLRSSSTFILSLSLSLSLSLLSTLSLCFFLRFSSTCFCFCFSPRKKKTPEKKNESVFIYVTLPIIHFLNGLKVDY